MLKMSAVLSVEYDKVCKERNELTKELASFQVAFERNIEVLGFTGLDIKYKLVHTFPSQQKTVKEKCRFGVKVKLSIYL